MSFGVSINNSWLEYGSDNMFAQKRNLFRPEYYKMLSDILRFNKHALRYLQQDCSLQECLDELRMGQWFRHYYLLPMGAAIWSCPVKSIMQFPAATFVQFFKNHGLLKIRNRPQWYTVTGGSREYTSRLLANLKAEVKLNCAVRRIYKQEAKWSVTDSTGSSEAYDNIIFACHADQAVELLPPSAAPQAKILSAFRYQNNHIITHSDTSFMPKNRNCWASWVYLSAQQQDSSKAVSLTYWMNNLQGLKTEVPIFVTLNPTKRPQEDLILDEHEFSHPIFDRSAIAAQAQIASVQGADGLWFCGAYQRYGFHEDGLWSAINIAKKMKAIIPW